MSKPGHAPFSAEFTVRGAAKPQPRGRASAVKCSDGKWRARVHNPGTAEFWKSQVIATAAKHRPLIPIAAPVEVELDFFLPRSKKYNRQKDPEGPIPHTTRPDGENLEKAVIDALMHDGWFADDSVVWKVVRRKMSHEKHGVPRMTISIKTTRT